MKVRVNCPIAGCGTRVDVKHLTRHFENVHKLDGELLLRLHPSSAYQHTPADDQEPEEAEQEQEQGPEEEAELEPGEE